MFTLTTHFNRLVLEKNYTTDILQRVNKLKLYFIINIIKFKRFVQLHSRYLSRFLSVLCI